MERNNRKEANDDTNVRRVTHVLVFDDSIWGFFISIVDTDYYLQSAALPKYRKLRHFSNDVLYSPLDNSTYNEITGHMAVGYDKLKV